MGPMEYLRILRRRWWVLLITALLGVGLATATQSSELQPGTTAPAPNYSATTTMISDPLARGNEGFGVQWDKLALLVTKGDIPQAVERKLGTLRKPPQIPRATQGGGRRRGSPPRTVSFPFATVT